MTDTKPTRSRTAKPKDSAAKSSDKIDTGKPVSAPPTDNPVGASRVKAAKVAAVSSSESDAERRTAETAEPVAKPRTAQASASTQRKTRPAAKRAGESRAPVSPPHSRLVDKSAELPDQVEIDRMIAEAAYYLAERRNFAPGWEQEDWETARKEVLARFKKRKA